MKHNLRICLVSLVVIVLPWTVLGEVKTGRDALKLMQQGKTAEAIQIFENLASKHDDRAMVQLGLYYYQGIGVKKDYSIAMDWFLKAYAKQNIDAFVNLGVMHRDGQGVPKNKKIAYCIFLTTHMCGLGTESTHSRSNSCLRRLIREFSKDDLRDCLSNYTLQYMTAYIELKGKTKGIPEKFKPSEDNPALKDMNWWFDSELDAIFGEPTKKEKMWRQVRDALKERHYAELRHTLVIQIRFPNKIAHHYRSVEFITEAKIGGANLISKKELKNNKYSFFESEILIDEDRHRYITIEIAKGKSLVFQIAHPARPSPCDWCKWQKPLYAIKDSMDKFALLSGKKLKSKTTTLPTEVPELRFKVVK